MKILFIDDEYERYKAIEGPDILWCDSPEKAISALQNNSFDVVSFDHDLAGKKGTQVSYWILEQNHIHNVQFPFQGIVHSMNPVGAKHIMRDLVNASIKCRYMPFNANKWLAFVANLKTLKGKK